MNEKDRARMSELDKGLTFFAEHVHPLPGVVHRTQRDVLLKELVVSLRRVEYPGRLLERVQSVRRTDPADIDFFDPLRAAVYHRAAGNYDEACWLVFLFVQLGARKAGHWRLMREIYGRLGEEPRWDWPRVSADPTALTVWLSNHSHRLERRGDGRGFGNHRKFESLKHTGKTVDTYISWVGPAGHENLFNKAQAEAQKRGGSEDEGTFDVLYHSMDDVWRFGRLAKFDYLCMLGKLRLAPIQPGSTYMKGATGPMKGARLLFTGSSRSQWRVDFPRFCGHLG